MMLLENYKMLWITQLICQRGELLSIVMRSAKMTKGSRKLQNVPFVLTLTNKESIFTVVQVVDISFVVDARNHCQNR